MKIISEKQWNDLEIIWDYMRIESNIPIHADAIVIGGSGRMLDGAKRAKALYDQNVASVIVVSGFANPLYNTSITEAVSLAVELQDNGIPESAILIEDKAENTGQNILFSAKILEENNIQVKKVILIQKPFMTRRFLATAQAQWPSPKPEFFVTSTNTDVRSYYRLATILYGAENNPTITAMLGDYERISLYPSRGFSTQQPQSSVAETAYKNLKQEGFTGKQIR